MILNWDGGMEYVVSPDRMWVEYDITTDEPVTNNNPSGIAPILISTGMIGG